MQVVELSGISAEELTEKLWQYTDKSLIDSYYESLGLGNLCAVPGLS